MVFLKYFSALRKWGSTPDSGMQASAEVIEIEALLRQYNDKLKKAVAVDDDLVKSLDQCIVRLQTRLSD
jgi:hypothetical protein